jgi:phosphonate transport system permease protein
MVAGAVFAFLLGQLNVKTLGEAVFEPPHKKMNATPKSWFKTFWGLQLILWFVASFVAGVEITKMDLSELFSPAGFGGAQRIFSALATPNFEILPHAVLAMVETIFIAFLSTVLAIPIAFVLAFFTAKNIMGKSKAGLLVYGFLRTFINITRSIEPLIWAIVFSVWVGIGAFAGMLALMLVSISSLVKQYSEIIECVEDGPIEGIESTGATTLQTVWFAIVPQIVLPYVSYTIYRWDINVRMATVIGLVGGGGIGTMLIQFQGQALWHEVGTIVLLIAAVVWVMDISSAYIRESLK